MADLIPTFIMPSPAAPATVAPPAFRSSFLWDFDAGDFVIDGAGRVVVADGRTAWIQWCVKAVLIERASSLVYSWRYGVEMDAALRAPSREAIRSRVARAIQDALMVDRRTKAVEGFAIQIDGSSLRVEFTVVPAVGKSERLTVVL